MKKLLPAALLILLSVCAFSQEFSVGMVAGLSSTSVVGLNVEVRNAYKQYHRVGVVAGAFVNRSFTKKSSLQLELLYATKGSYYPPDSMGNNQYRLRLTYLEIPLLYKYRFHLNVNNKPFDKLEVEIGPSFGILLNSWQESNYSEFTITDPFKNTDLLINIGLNYFFTPTVSLDIRFNNSIIPIRDQPNSPPGLFSGGDFNSAFNYTLRFAFR